MAHNFPTNKEVVIRGVLDYAEQKTILLKAAQHGCPVYRDTLNRIFEVGSIREYDTLIFSQESICGVESSTSHTGRHVVSVKQFIDFIIGEGSLVEPITIKLTNDYSAVINQDNIQVGCQIISHEVLEQVYKASLEMRG